MSQPFLPLPAEATDPGFRRALQVATVAAAVQQHLGAGAELQGLEPDYVRWKDADGSLVGYRATVAFAGALHHTYVTVRTAAPQRLVDEAARLQHRADASHAGLRGLALVPGGDLLLLAFPVDRALPDLRRLLRISKLKNLVAAVCPGVIPAGCRIKKQRSRCDVVRYKPERRAVLHWQLGIVATDGSAAGSPASQSLWVRVFAAPAAGLVRAATAAARVAGVRCPMVLGVAHERLLVESHVDGGPWQDRLGDAAAPAAAAAALARLHAAAAPAGLPLRGSLQELDRVLRAVEDLTRLDPDLGAAARAIAERLSRRVPPASPLVLAHGDLHLGQVLLQDGEAALVDFDRVCLAPVACDLASLLVQAAASAGATGLAAAERCQQAYGQRRSLPNATELAWWVAGGFVQSAAAAFRTLRADWPAVAAARLAAAAARLGDERAAGGRP